MSNPCSWFCRSPTFQATLTNGNYFFTFIFALESFVKLCAMSPRYFFAVRIILILILTKYKGVNDKCQVRHCVTNALDVTLTPMDVIYMGSYLKPVVPKCVVLCTLLDLLELGLSVKLLSLKRGAFLIIPAKTITACCDFAEFECM